MAPPATPAKRLYGRISVAIADTTTLQGVGVTDESRVDGCLVLKLDDTSLWRFNSGSSAAAAADVIVPSTGTGRWLRIAAFEGVPVDSTETAITAGATRTQAGAYALTKEISRVDTSTAPAAGALLGDGVRLMASVAGMRATLINNTANPIQVYGAGTDTINGVATATGIAVPPNAVQAFYCPVAGAWNCDPGFGFNGALPTFLAVSGITAGTTRTQAGATALAADFNRVSTSTAPAAGAILGDGVKLPAAATGLDVLVVNDTANPIQLYGAGTDTVNGVAAATGIAIPAKATYMCTCSAAAAGWQVQSGAGTSGALATRLSADAITAAGTTQATATPLSALVNTIGTVASGTGVNLPAAAAGLQVSVINAGANPLLVYPVQGGTETINGVAASTGVSILPGANAEFTATTATAWTTLPASAKQAAFNTLANADAAFLLTAAQITGGTATVDTHMTGAITAGRNAQLPTVASMVLAMHSPTVGSSFRLRLVNFQGGAFAMTVVTNTGWTLTGTMSIAQNTWREFVVTLTSLTTATIQNVAVGTIS